MKDILIMQEEVGNSLQKVKFIMENYPINISDDMRKEILNIFFMSLADEMLNLSQEEDIDYADLLKMATTFGRELKKLIKIYTGKDFSKCINDNPISF